MPGILCPPCDAVTRKRRRARAPRQRIGPRQHAVRCWGRRWGRRTRRFGLGRLGDDQAQAGEQGEHGGDDEGSRGHDHDFARPVAVVGRILRVGALADLGDDADAAGMRLAWRAAVGPVSRGVPARTGSVRRCGGGCGGEGGVFRRCEGAYSHGSVLLVVGRRFTSRRRRPLSHFRGCPFLRSVVALRTR